MPTLHHTTPATVTPQITLLTPPGQPKMPNLQTLYKERCTELGIKANSRLCGMLPEDGNLSSLDLSSNMIGNKGLLALLGVIEACQALDTLCLNGNMLASSVMKDLAGTLRVHKGVRSLDLSDNDIRLAGPDLVDLLKQNRNIVDLNITGTHLRPLFVNLITMQLKKNVGAGGGGGAASEAPPAAPPTNAAAAETPAGEPERAAEGEQPQQKEEEAKQEPPPAEEKPAEAAPAADTAQPEAEPDAKPDAPPAEAAEPAPEPEAAPAPAEADATPPPPAADEAPAAEAEAAAPPPAEEPAAAADPPAPEAEAAVPKEPEAEAPPAPEAEAEAAVEAVAAPPAPEAEAVVEAEAEAQPAPAAAPEAVAEPEEKKAEEAPPAEEKPAEEKPAEEEKAKEAEAEEASPVEEKQAEEKPAEEEKAKETEAEAAPPAAEAVAEPEEKKAEEAPPAEEKPAEEEKAKETEAEKPPVEVAAAAGEEEEEFPFGGGGGDEVESPKGGFGEFGAFGDTTDALFSIDQAEPEAEQPRESNTLGLEPRGATRRATVCAEAYSEKQIDDFSPDKFPKDDATANFLLQALEANQLFNHLDDHELQVVVDAMKAASFAAGEVLYNEGDADMESTYVVKEGSVAVSASGKEGGETVQPSAFVGEVFLLYPQTSVETAKAAADCIVFSLDRRTFKFILHQASKKKRAMYEGFLMRVPFLSTLKKDQILLLADALKSTQYEDADTVIKYGEEGNWLHIVVEGTVRVIGRDEKDDKIEVCTFTAGDCVGELEFLNQHKTVADVIADGKVRTAKMNRRHFEMCMGPVVDILRKNADKLEVYAYYRDTLAKIKQDA